MKFACGLKAGRYLSCARDAAISAKTRTSAHWKSGRGQGLRGSGIHVCTILPKSWRPLMSILVFWNCLGFYSPQIERDYLWWITIDIDSCSVVRPVGEDQVRN